MLHEPARGRCGATDADRPGVAELRPVKSRGIADEYRRRVDAQTLVVEHPTVGTLGARNKDDDIVGAREVAQVVNAVGYLTADGVMICELGVGGLATLNFLNHSAEALKGHGRLAIQGDVSVEVDAVKAGDVFNDYGSRVGLPDEAVDLGVAALSIDDNLGLGRCGECLLYASLEGEHNGTGRVDDVDVVATGGGVGRGWLSMGAKQDVGVSDVVEVSVGDCDKPLGA